MSSRPIRAGPGGFPNNGFGNNVSRSLRRLRAQAHQLLKGAGKGRIVVGGGSLLAAGAAAVAGSPGDDPYKDVPLVAPPKKKTLEDFGHEKRKVTDFFIVFNVICFALQWLSKDILTLWGCKINELIIAGQYWRLFTPIFLHSNVIHLAFNTYALHILGPQVEIVSGGQRTAIVYILSGVLATTLSFFKSAAPSLGASGCVFGLGAALAVFYWRHKDLLGRASDAGLESLGRTLAINVVYSLINRKIDNWGHLGGLLAGAGLAWLLGPRLTLGPGLTISDKPPLPWFAFQHSRELRMRRAVSSAPASSSSTSAQQQPQGGTDAERRQQEEETEGAS